MKVSRSAQPAFLEVEVDMLDRDESTTRRYDEYFARQQQLARDSIIAGIPPMSGEQMSVERHYCALISIGDIGEEWRVYDQRVGFDTRPLAERTLG